MGKTTITVHSTWHVAYSFVFVYEVICVSMIFYQNLATNTTNVVFEVTYEQQLILYQERRHLDDSYTIMHDALPPFKVLEVKQQHGEAATGVKNSEFNEER